MEKRCSCCGQVLPEYGGIVADSDRGEIRFGGKMIRNLTSTEFELFRFLLDKAGMVASKDALFDRMYQLVAAEEDVPSGTKIVDVYVCHLRKKLIPLGLEIATVWGRGYRLVEPMKELTE